MGDVCELAGGGDDDGFCSDGDEGIVHAVQVSCTVVDDSYFH